MSQRIPQLVCRAVRRALGVASPLPLILGCVPALAQEAPASATAPNAQADLQEIVVTSYRQSVQTALEEKRNAIQPIETIVAEDIGKMPDQNVAESLQRLPGVSINRSGGHGTQVLIDGLQN